MEKVVLAYSGGLDTSFCAVYLSKNLNLEVHAVLVNLGGFSPEELEQAERRALELGAASFHVLDEQEAYYHSCLRFLIYGNVLKNGTYPLSVSSERVYQASALALYAKKLGAQYIAHGSTGAGNDQIRFDYIFQILSPEIKIVTPIRELGYTRTQEIEFLESHGFKMDFKKSMYSINKGIWGTSVGGEETLSSNLPLPPEAYPSEVTAKEPLRVGLTFKKGEITGVDDREFSMPLEAIKYLESLAAPFGIGRDIHVGDTIIGLKGRVGFQASAAMILIKAHHLLEKHTLSKAQLLLKEQLALQYGNYLHDAQVLDPVMKDLEAFFESSQEKVSGQVFVELYPHYFTLLGIESPNDLMQSKAGVYGEVNKGWSAEDAKGFSKIYANALTIYHQIHSHE